MLMLRGDALRWLDELLSRFPDDDPAQLVEALAAGVIEHDGPPRSHFTV